MTVTSIAAESPSTRCAICARPARRGDRLCAQCKTAVKRARQVPSLHAALLPRAGAGAAASGHPGGRRQAAAYRPGALRAPHCRRFPADGAPTRRSSRSVWPCPSPGISRRTNRKRRRTASAVRRRRARRPLRRCATRRRRERSRRCHRRRQTAGSSGDEAIAQIEWTLPPAPPAHSPGASPGRKSARDARSAGDDALRPIEARSPDAECRRPHQCRGRDRRCVRRRAGAGNAGDSRPPIAGSCMAAATVTLRAARTFSSASSARSGRGCSSATANGAKCRSVRAASGATTLR